MNLNKILKNIYFENIIKCSEEDIRNIRNIRNELNIRKNMTNNKLISNNEHIEWYQSLKNSKPNFFYAIRYHNDLIGGVGVKSFDEKSRFAEWSFYVSEKKKFTGLGAALEFKAINFIFELFRLKILYCYVLKHNPEVIKLHKRFGFNEITFQEYTKNIKLVKKSLDASFFYLNKKKWNEINTSIYNKYFKRKK